jgi:hypothetical protein
MRRALEDAEAEVALWRELAAKWEKRALTAEAVIEAARARCAEHSSGDLAVMLALKAYEEWKP